MRKELKGKRSEGLLETKPGQKRVYETIKGFWTDEDYKAYMDAYEKEFSKELRSMGNWVKIVDMREYNMSSVTTAMSEHLKWCKNNKLACAIVIADKAIVKLQIGNSVKEKHNLKESFLEDKYFTTPEEAYNYAKSIGF